MSITIYTKVLYETGLFIDVRHLFSAPLTAFVKLNKGFAFQVLVIQI